MEVIDPGHKFRLNVFDLDTVHEMHRNHHGQVLTFVKREGPGYPGNVGHHPGTILQELWRAEISRIKYLDKQIPHPANDLCIKNLRQCIFWLELRAAERHGAKMEFQPPYSFACIEDIPICPKCGHVFPHTHDEKEVSK